MGQQLDFIFGIHCHQPVGNFERVFEWAYQRAYRPFIDVLARHEGVKLVLHYTGPLLEFFAEAHPEFLEQLRELAARGQVELLGGGFYEPILAVIPEQDALGQLELLAGYLEREFLQRPQGIWLAERVWEPQLPSLLARAGVEYLPLDDFHFRRTGLEEHELFSYYLTEDRGQAVGVFPISAALRYLIPFRKIERVLQFFRERLTAEGRPLLTLIDDGEKFGIWPGTYDWVYKDGWLDRFFAALEKNSDWIRTRTMADYFSAHRPRGTVYFPTASYFELTEWALPATAGHRLRELEDLLGKDLERYRPLIAGGYWRNFLSKYPEGNHLHKRMLHVSQQLARLSAQRPITPELRAAQRELYRAQSNDAYWHGLFGGIYLPHLRDALYRHLIAATTLLERVESSASSSADAAKSRHWARTSAEDLDADREDEILVDTESWFACFKLQGGMLVELDDKRHNFNVLNTIARRPEIYHQDVPSAKTARELARISACERERRSIHELQLAKQSGLEKFLIYDRYRRGALHDHFLAAARDMTRTRFARNEYEELGDFITGTYTAEYEQEGSEARVQLQRIGSVDNKRVSLIKAARFRGPKVLFTYSLINRDSEMLTTRFGVEFNLALLAGDSPDRYVLIDGHRPRGAHFAGNGSHKNIKKIELVNEYERFVIELKLSKPANLWRFPIYTVNNSEAGFERVYQETVLFFWWDLELRPGAEFGFQLGYCLKL